MESEPDYGQWTPDGRSAQEQGRQVPQQVPQQAAYEEQQQSSGYEQQSGYGQQQYPGYDPAGYQQSPYEQASYDQSGYQQADYGRQEYGGQGYEQQAYPQPYQDQSQGQAYDGQGQGYQQAYEYSGEYPGDYPGQQGQGYAGYPEQQVYAPAPEGEYTGQAYAAGQYYQAAPGEEQPAESTASWSSAGMYPPGDAPADTPADSSADTPADPSADAPDAGAEAAVVTGGSTAVGGGRAARRGGRGGGESEAEAAGAGTPPLARLLAAATGRAPGTDRRTFIVRAALGGAALVVLGVAGFAVAGGGSGPAKPKASAAGASSVDLAAAHTKAWAAPADAGSANGNDGLVGSWLTTGAVIRGDGMGVTAYAIGSGSKLWSVAPPVTGAVPCAMSSTVGSTGLGAVLFQAKPGTGQSCSLLVAVNTGTGATSWKATLPGSPTAQSSVMISDTQVVAVDGSAATGYNPGTGKQSWSYAGPGKYCVLAGNGTAGTLLLQSTCADTNPKQQAVSLNADTGKLAWWRGLPQTAASYTVLSAVPAVVGVHMTNPAQDTLMSFSAQGDNQATIPVSQVGGLLDSLHGSFDPDPALFFQGSTMLAELSPTTASGTSTGTATPATTGSGAITAFDLVGGKQLWQTAPAEKGQSALVGIDASGGVVATEERIGQPARLSHFDLGTGKEAPGGAFPQGTLSLLTSGRVLFHGSAVAVLPQFTSTSGTAATFYSGGSNG